jgi:hypothetical protein
MVDNLGEHRNIWLPFISNGLGHPEGLEPSADSHAPSHLFTQFSFISLSRECWKSKSWDLGDCRRYGSYPETLFWEIEQLG